MCKLYLYLTSIFEDHGRKINIYIYNLSLSEEKNACIQFIDQTLKRTQYI